MPIVGMELRRVALAALLVADPHDKARATQALARAWPDDAIDTATRLDEPPGVPGRPERPRLVPPRDVPHRAIGTPEGRSRLMHAVAHIEFNAINLALDACWRFAGMPTDFYRDWLHVATEEAKHFVMVDAHLQRLGARYGDFDAHDGLWQMAQATRHDVLERMALVPCLLEARGLDVTPAMQRRLAQAGDDEAVAVLEVILRDEVGHVAVGNHWFRLLCAQRDLEPLAAMRHLMKHHRAPRLKAPLNAQARLKAGFTAAELEGLLED